MFKKKTISLESIQERMPVWDALSEFFLDTELQESDYQRIATVLASSPYSEKKLYQILRFEVYPPCKWNLFNIAGEWAGFTKEWILDNIATRYDRRLWLPPFFASLYKDHWKKKVLPLFRALREKNSV
ncbi:MAG: hypothetical protein AABZ60_05010 [Planctomycetota bacterium]